MSDTTSRLGLYKPDGSEDINVETDLNDNFDKIDLNVGFRPVTSTTRPSTVWAGLQIVETDTNRTYVSNGSAPASASWVEILTAGASFTLTGTGSINLSGSVSGTDKLAALVAGDSVDRFRLSATGRMEWGSGSATRDTNLYRSAANTLKTDDDLVVKTHKAHYGESGSLNVSFSAAASYTTDVVFSTPFTSTPMVMTNIASGSGPTARWASRAITVSTTGFTLFLWQTDVADSDAAFSAQPVQWIALAP